MKKEQALKPGSSKLSAATHANEPYPTVWTSAHRRMFMRQSLENRRRILAEQADRAAPYYDRQAEARERESWQGGDIVDV